MSLWKRDKLEMVQRILVRLLESATPSGLPLQSRTTFDLAALSAASNGRALLSSDALSIILRMREKGLSTPDEFASVHHALSNKHAMETATNTKRWRFYIPLDVAIDADVARPIRLRVLGTDFQITEWDKATRRNRVAIRRAACEAHIRITNKVDFKPPRCCLSTTAEGLSALGAFRKIDPAFDTLRAVVELTFGLYRSSYFSPPTSRCALASPVWFIAMSDDGETEWLRFLVDGQKTSQPLRIDRDSLDVLKQNARLHTKSPPDKSTLALVVDALRLYLLSLTEARDHRCFIGLWQMAETMTLAERSGGNTKRVVEQLASITAPRLPDCIGLADALSMLSVKRNDLVHRGNHDGITQDDVNMLKLVCELYLTWLQGASARLSTQSHLRWFYQLRGESDGDLDAIAKTARYVKQWRDQS